MTDRIYRLNNGYVTEYQEPDGSWTRCTCASCCRVQAAVDGSRLVVEEEDDEAAEHLKGLTW